MEELKKRILLLNLQPKDAPDGIPVQTFGNWLRAVKKPDASEHCITPAAKCLLDLLCWKLENSK